MRALPAAVNAARALASAAAAGYAPGMAPPPLLQLADVGLGFVGQPLFDGLSLVIHPGDRLALVGRNGSGKSTLLKVMAGLVEPDRGLRTLGPGVSVGYLEQFAENEATLAGHVKQLRLLQKVLQRLVEDSG